MVSGPVVLTEFRQAGATYRIVEDGTTMYLEQQQTDRMGQVRWVDVAISSDCTDLIRRLTRQVTDTGVEA